MDYELGKRLDAIEDYLNAIWEKLQEAETTPKQTIIEGVKIQKKDE